MKEETHKNFMELIIPKSPPPLSLTITVAHHPKFKIRIPIPKALIKAIHGKRVEDAVRKDEDRQFRKRKKNRLEKLKGIFSKKVSSILPSVFRSRKPPAITGNGGSDGEICEKRFGVGGGDLDNGGMLMIVKQESCGNNRLGKLLFTGHRKVKIGWSMRRNEANYKRISIEDSEEQDREDEQEELCKKRILMGGKCTPLNHSGVLSYDQDGVLLPDFLW